MKYRYGARSLDRLSTCDQKVVNVMQSAIDTGLIDIIIIEGRRSKALQDQYFDNGMSKVKWPNSKHNVVADGDLSEAVDAAPFVAGKVSWKKEHCIFMAGVVLCCARRLGVNMRWGGNWDMDGEPITDQSFQDLVHFELVE